MLTDFGKICRKIRIDANELLADMADRLGVSASFLSAVENGKKSVPDNWPRMIADLYALDTMEYKELQQAAEDSVNVVKIRMQDMEQRDRNLVLAFAREFENLDATDKDKLLKLLRRQ